MKTYDSQKALISLHVPKCGGQSMRRVLLDWFGDQVRFHYFQAQQALPERHEPARGMVIHGHFNRNRGFGVEDYYPDVDQFITVIRDPLEMALSNYFYWKHRRREEKIRDGRLVPGSDEDFRNIEDFFAKRPRSRLLTFLPRDLDGQNYRQVFEERFVWIGVLECLQASIDQLADTLGRPRLRVPHLNTAPRDEEISPSTRDLFIRNNHLEFEIYNLAREILHCSQRLPAASASRPGRIVYFSRFNPSLARGGGARRLLQIREALQDLRPELIASGQGDGISRETWQFITRLEKSGWEKEVQRHDTLRRWPGKRGKYAFRLHHVARDWCAGVKVADLTLALMDDPLYLEPLFLKLVEQGIPVVAVCHNIESLVGQGDTPAGNLELLDRELELLRQAALVITISRDESVILTNAGCQVRFLEYFPIAEHHARLMAIRARRPTCGNGELLLLGSAGNAPTRDGMAHLISAWPDAAAGSGLMLIVAGYQVDDYFPAGSHRGVEVRGALSDKELDDLLARVSAAVCWQDYGGGALTRISEMLAAGVPVLANQHAARSYHGCPGVIEVASVTELVRQARELTERMPEVPHWPQPDYPALVRRVSSLQRELPPTVDIGGVPAASAAVDDSRRRPLAGLFSFWGKRHGR